MSRSGGIWDVCTIEQVTPKTQTRGWPKIASRNKFGDLEDSDDEEDSEEEEIKIEPPPALPKKGFESVQRKRWRKVKFGDECDLDVCPVEAKDIKMSMKFEVADVKKPLISVKRICEKGNRVSFGPKDEDNFIQNKDTGDKILVRPNGKGSYLMDVSFVNGTSTSITVDSGAEENVCPYDWGSQFGMRDPVSWKNFCGANGSRIDHYGTRDVKVVSSTF